MVEEQINFCGPASTCTRYAGCAMLPVWFHALNSVMATVRTEDIQEPIGRLNGDGSLSPGLVAAQTVRLALHGMVGDSGEAITDDEVLSKRQLPKQKTREGDAARVVGSCFTSSCEE